MVVMLRTNTENLLNVAHAPLRGHGVAFDIVGAALRWGQTCCANSGGVGARRRIV